MKSESRGGGGQEGSERSWSFTSIYEWFEVGAEESKNKTKIEKLSASVLKRLKI